MQLDDLRYFVHVATSGSFARGAALSHVSPPAVSKAIRRLEDELGAPVFARTTRRVALTPEGEALLRRSRRIFDELDALRVELDTAGARVAGDLRVGAMEVFSIGLLPRALSALTREHPEVHPRTYEMIPQRMEQQLALDRIDVGFTIGGGGGRGLDYHALGSSRGVLVCGVGHPLYRRGTVRAAELRTHPSVVPEFLGMEHLPSLDQFPSDRYARKVGATIELLQMAVQLAIEGGYLGYFPEVSVRPHLESGSLRALDGLKGHATFALRAITRSGRPMKPAVRLLIEALRSAIAG
ncbi:MAG: LysR family transcriptional regulator [Sandaracinaceae bacterium]